MLKRITFVLLVWAQWTMAIPPDSLNLKEIWKVLSVQNLTLQQQRAAIEAASATLNQARTNLWPTIQVGGSYQYISDIPRLSFALPLPGVQFPEIEAGAHNQFDFRLQISQPLFTGFKLTNAVAIETQRVAAQRIQAMRVRQQLLYQSGHLYLAYHLARLQQRTLQTSWKRLQASLIRSRSLFKHQQATAFDTLRLANQQLRLRNQMAQIQRQQEQILVQLQALLNYSTLPVLSSPDTTEPMLLVPEKVYWQQALANRPELQSLKIQKQIAHLTQRIAQAEYFPQVYAFASFHYGNPGANFFERRWNFYTVAGVQMQFDLWNWGRTHYRIQEARARWHSISLKEAKIIQDVRTEIHSLYLEMQQVRANQRYLQHLVEQERLRFQLVQNGFQAGVATSLDLQEAESALTAAQLQRYQNQIAWLRLKLQMALATGTIGQNLEESHVQ